MKTILALLLALLGACLCLPAAATTYFLSPTGSDANSGLSAAAPWLTPNHPVNCGDTVLAAPGAYDYHNFQGNLWGAVTCPAQNNVAWLKCATFDTCTITTPPDPLLDPATNFGHLNYTARPFTVGQPFWGVQGWEISNTTVGSASGSCFDTAAHHTIFANNVANICASTGIGVSADYAVAIGNIVYGAGQSNIDCHTGIDSFAPTAYDTAPGTHIYIAGNFVWGTTNPGAPPWYNTGCADGNGIMLDTLATKSCTNPFLGTALVENNIAFGNGGAGVRAEYSGPMNNALYNCTSAVPAGYPLQILRHNTSWNDGTGNYAFGSQNGGEMQIQSATNVLFTLNLASEPNRFLYWDIYPEADGTYAFASPFQCSDCDAADTVSNNFLYSSTAVPLLLGDRNGTPITTSSFSYATTNITGIDPQFANPSTPAAPACAAFADVPHCAASIIANFTPTNAAAKPYGYQTVTEPPSMTPCSPVALQRHPPRRPYHPRLPRRSLPRQRHHPPRRRRKVLISSPLAPHPHSASPAPHPDTPAAESHASASAPSSS